MEDYFEIGRIVNTQGIKGDVRVVPMTDDHTRFELLDFVYVQMRNELKKLHIEHVWYHKQFVILKFKEIGDMTEAEKYKNCLIKITPELALPLSENEFYIRDLLGLLVVTDEGEELGLLDDIIETGANDVYVVNTGGKELLIPAIKQCILKVDLENKKMTVKLLEGLRD